MERGKYKTQRKFSELLCLYVKNVCSFNSQTRRLSTEKQRLDDQIKAMTEMANKQTGDIYSQG